MKQTTIKEGRIVKIEAFEKYAKIRIRDNEGKEWPLKVFGKAMEVLPNLKEGSLYEFECFLDVNDYKDNLYLNLNIWKVRDEYGNPPGISYKQEKIKKPRTEDERIEASIEAKRFNPDNEQHAKAYERGQDMEQEKVKNLKEKFDLDDDLPF